MSNLPFQTNPFLYINGLEISNHATVPNTKLTVAAGQCRDSTDVYQITLGSAATIDTANVGLNGIDTGVLEASKVYAVHVISDPVSGQPTGAMVSLSATAPYLPFGYSAFRLIGYIVTDSSVHFLPGYWSGNNNARLFMYDAPQATAITAGADTSYTAITLTTLVPAVNNLSVWFAVDLTPAAASRIMSLQPFGATGNAVSVTSQVTAVHVTANLLVLSRLDSGVPKINYKWSAGGGDAVAINVAGYEFYI
jgi:hypothetical protein